MHTIKFVSQQTGLSQHTIRAWERRYAALTPDRTTTNRRLYSAEDMRKLSLLRRGVEAGHSIGQIAGLSVNELELRLSESQLLGTVPVAAQVPEDTAAVRGNAAAICEECLRAIERMDAEGLENSLARAAALLGAATMLETVMMPLLETIGDKWHRGEIRPAHEHMATAVLRTVLGRMLTSFQPPLPAPCIVFTTPVGQIHELGALIGAVAAASEGWRVVYLGPNLPAEEIAGAAHHSGARAVALSIVYPSDDPRLNDEIAALRQFTGPSMPILAGGRARAAYRSALDSVGATQIEDIQNLRATLQALRSQSPELAETLAP